MANRMNEIVGHLRRVVLRFDGAGQTDGKLLGSFIEGRDEAAFEALVRRHGPMVLGVCRRILRHEEDAQDAFQAIFLVLVRKAASVVPRERVGNWLYGVAQQTAVRVRAMNAKRWGREKQVTVMPDVAKEHRDDLTHLVDQELSRLPEKYRVAIVLCDLEGRTRKEVGKQLGWPEGSVSTRLSRGRAMLAKRLAKHGLVFSGEALAVSLSQNVASACLPPSLVSTTVKAATVIAASQLAANTLVSAKVAAITQGVLTSMLLTKLKTVAVVSFMVCVLAVGVGARFPSGQTLAEPTQQPIERKAGPAANAILVDVGKKPISEECNLRLEMLEKKIRALENQIHFVAKAIKPTAAQRADKKEVRIFTLGKLKAEEVAYTIEKLFSQDVHGSIAVSSNTNTIIVYAYPEDLKITERVISCLEKLPIQPVEEQPIKGQPRRPQGKGNLPGGGH
jgi:RNA polymerase sigma factor (sigma-70 family)